MVHARSSCCPRIQFQSIRSTFLRRLKQTWKYRFIWFNVWQRVYAYMLWVNRKVLCWAWGLRLELEGSRPRIANWSAKRILCFSPALQSKCFLLSANLHPSRQPPGAYSRTANPEDALLLMNSVGTACQQEQDFLWTKSFIGFCGVLVEFGSCNASRKCWLDRKVLNLNSWKGVNRNCQW